MPGEDPRKKRRPTRIFAIGKDGKKELLMGGKPVKESPEQPGLHSKPSKFLSGGQTKIAKKAPPFDEIDEKDFAVLRAEKAKGKGKVMKAKRGKFSDLRKLAKAKGLPAPSPLLAGKGFGKMAGNFPAIKTAPGSVASKAEVKQGTKRLGKFIPRRLKLVGAALSAAGVGAVGQKLIDKMKKKKKKKELEGDIKGSIAPYKMKKKMGGGLAAATERLRAQGKMGGGMMKKYSNGGDVYGKMADKKFEKYATSKEAQLHAKDFDAGLNRAERRAASETMLAYKKKQKLGKQAAVKKMGGGMMNKPMGYKSGKSVMAKGCKLGRKKPTKMYT
jgi:hypothetical protein